MFHGHPSPDFRSPQAPICPRIVRGILCFTLLGAFAIGPTAAARGAQFQSLRLPGATPGSTWQILDRDGANREVEPYLSSLGTGEPGTGVVSSPPFELEVDTITFTIRGHDGQQGGQGNNYIALVDARKGEILEQSPPPQDDNLQEQSWDVAKWRGKEVRIEVHDHDSGSAFAWLGIGRIDAGTLEVDFREGLPDGWARPVSEADQSMEVLTDGVPFRRDRNRFNIIPETGVVEIPCGFSTERLYFLGCTVAGGKPATAYGGIEIHYASGSPDVIPLMCGFTIDGRNKLLSPSPAMHLHPSADPFQHYLVIEPRDEVITKLRLVAEPQRLAVPRITAITCETDATGDRLDSLPEVTISDAESEWIREHQLSAETLDLNARLREIRRAHRQAPPDAGTSVRFRKRVLDREFRSEGVALGDFNGDGQVDIAAGNMYYAGPNWEPVPMRGEPVAYNRLGYSDAFLCFADDIDGDGDTDLLTVGFPGNETRWWENPGQPGTVWSSHLAVEKTGNETPFYGDLTGNGQAELVFMHENRAARARPGDDPTKPWEIRYIAGSGDPGAVHGLGVGDMNGDGRRDVLIPQGWWEQPAQATDTLRRSPRAEPFSPWRFHPADFFGGAQLCVADISGDGDADVLGTSAHAYGIAWTEHTGDGWTQHMIDDSYSQTHAVATADIDGDGRRDFVTGKRFWAHNGHDPGSFEPAYLYWYRQTQRDGKPAWERHLIDAESGVGLHFQVRDVTGDGLLDIVTANKLGVFLFEQLK